MSGYLSNITLVLRSLVRDRTRTIVADSGGGVDHINTSPLSQEDKPLTFS